MEKATPLNAEDIASMRPKYERIPADWTMGGSEGKIDKRGRPFTLVHFYKGAIKYSLFTDKLAKDENGVLIVESAHLAAQIKRGDDWAKARE
jgi:hypothetical protein